MRNIALRKISDVLISHISIRYSLFQDFRKRLNFTKTLEPFQKSIPFITYSETKDKHKRDVNVE